MTRLSLLKKSVLIVSLLLAAILLAIVTKGRRHYEAYLQQQLIEVAQEHGVSVSAKTLHFTWFGIEIKTLSLFFPRAFIGLEFDRVNLTVLHPNLGSQIPELRFTANGYQGTAELNATFNLKTQASSGSASLRGFQLQLHPQLQALAITNGSLTAIIDHYESDAHGLKRAQGTLKLLSVEKPLPSTIPGRLLNLPFDLTIPALHDLSIVAGCSFEAPQVNCQEVRATSSLGSLAGHVGTALGKHAALNGELSISLTPEGEKLVGPWIPVLSGGRMQTPQKEFRLKISGTTALPRIQIL